MAHLTWTIIVMKAEVLHVDLWHLELAIRFHNCRHRSVIMFMQLQC